MKNIIPYEKDIKFDTKIAEITSISLEHEEKINDDEVLGDFIVFGDYKSHQISINKEDFKYRIPFSIQIPESIDINSIKIDINDFTYDIKSDDTLTIKIELSFEYDENNLIEEENEVDNIELIDEINEEENRLDDELNTLIEETNDNTKTIEEKNLEDDSINNNVINNTISSENTYIIYHVYIVSDKDSIESICQKFNVSKELLHEYNDFEEIQTGDKLLIPIEENE